MADTKLIDYMLIMSVIMLILIMPFVITYMVLGQLNQIAIDFIFFLPYLTFSSAICINIFIWGEYKWPTKS